MMGRCVYWSRWSAGLFNSKKGVSLLGETDGPGVGMLAELELGWVGGTVRSVGVLGVECTLLAEF